MGFFRKISGADDRYSKYKRVAEKMLLLVREQAKALDRNFEEVMNLDSAGMQSLRLSSFLAGAVGDAVENQDILEMRNWKFITLNRTIKVLDNVTKKRVLELKDNIYEIEGQLYITFIPDSDFVWIQEDYGREPR